MGLFGFLKKDNVAQPQKSPDELKEEAEYEHRLDGVEAVVEEGSALQSRFTATRIFLLGVFALAFKKRKGGEKWLGIMGPDFAWVSRADRKHIGDAMKFAAKVNDQARKQ